MAARRTVRRALAALAVVVGSAGLAACYQPAPIAGPVPTSGSGATTSGKAASRSGLASTRLTVPAGAEAPFDRPRTVLAPKGWSVSLLARTPGARLLAFAPDGRLLVSRPGSGDVLALDADGGGRRTLVGGLTQPHGLAFRGSILYVAESDRVDAFDYRDGSVRGRRTVLGGLPGSRGPDLGAGYAHPLKSVAVGRDGSLYVSVGSTGNTSEQDRSATPERAAVLRLAPGADRATTFARGVRNGTGLAVGPDGSVWTAVNDRDNIAYPYDRDFTGDGRSDLGAVLQDYVNDHPLEEVARLTPGRDLGWPYCNPDPDVRSGVPGSGLDYSNRPFVRDRQLNADGGKLDCGALPRVEQGLPAHSAPLGLAFVDGAGLPGLGPGALVGAHGSWNRQPPRAPEVVFLPWRDGGLGDARTLLGGFQGEDGSRWGRPVAAVPGPDGAVYVSDDLAGAIYRLAPAR